MATSTELEIVVRFKDLLTKGMKRGQRAVLRFTAVATKGFRGVTKAAGVLKNMLTGLPGILTAIATGGMAVLAKSMVEAASAAEQTASRFQILFGDIADAAQNTAETIASVNGRAVSDIQESMADFSLVLKEAGLSGDLLVQGSAALAQRALDVDAFTDASSRGVDVSNAFRAALLGEAEAAKGLGIFVQEGQLQQIAWAQGIEKSVTQMTQQEKTMLRLVGIMESLQDANGNNIITQDEFAVSVQRMKSQVKGLREEMGTRLVKAIQDTIKEVGGEAVVMEVLRTAFEFVVQVMVQFIQHAGGLIKMAKGISDALGEEKGAGGALKFVGEVATFVGNIISTAFSAAEVVVRGFEQGLDVVQFAIVAVWNALQLLAGALAWVILELVDYGVKAWGQFAKGIQWVVNVIKDGLLIAIEKMSSGLKTVLENMKAMLLFVAEWTPVGAAKFMNMANSIDNVIAGVDGFNASVQGMGDFSGLDGFIARTEEASGILEDLQGKALVFMGQQLEDFEGAGEAFVDDIMKDADATTAALEEMLQGMIELGFQGHELAGDIEAVLTQFESFEAGAAVTTDTAAQLAQAMEILGINYQEFIDAAGEGTNTAMQGAQSQMEKFMENAADIGKQLDEFGANSMQNFTNGLAGAFTDVVTGAKSAKDAFKDFALSFIAQTIQMIAQMLILRAISGVFGGFFADGGIIPGGTGGMQAFANGGVVAGGMGSWTPVKGYANGGPIVNKPHVAVIGEGQYNEAVVPLPDGRSIPVDMRGMGQASGNQATVNFTIQANDAQGFDQLLTERRRTIEDVISNGMTTRRSFRTTMRGEVV